MATPQFWQFHLGIGFGVPFFQTQWITACHVWHMLQAHHQSLTLPALTRKNLLRWIYRGWFQLIMEVFEDDVRTGMTAMTLMIQIRFVRCVVRVVRVIRAVQSKLLHKGLEALGVLADDFQQLWHWQRLQGPPGTPNHETISISLPLHTSTYIYQPQSPSFAA